MDRYHSTQLCLYIDNVRVYVCTEREITIIVFQEWMLIIETIDYALLWISIRSETVKEK